MFVEECIYVVGSGLSPTASVQVCGTFFRLSVLIIRDLTFPDFLFLSDTYKYELTEILDIISTFLIPAMYTVINIYIYKPTRTRGRSAGYPVCIIFK
jgi:hypothetical protein